MSSNLHWGILVPLAILASMIAVLNILVIVIVLRNKPLRSYTNGFLVSLAVSDLLVGIAFIPGYIIEPGLEMNGYLIAIILLANIGNIVCVTSERFIAVLKPFSYAIFICKHFKKAIIATWTIPTIISLLPLTWKGHSSSMQIHQGFQVFIAVGLILTPYIFIIWAYWKIFKEVRRQLSNINRLSGLSGEADRRKQIQGEAKVAKVFAAIAALASLSWLPVVYMTFCVVAERYDLTPIELSITHIFTLALNSIANPLVYCFYKEDFKRHLKRAFPCFSTQGVYQVREAHSFITLYSEMGTVANDREGVGSNIRLNQSKTTVSNNKDCTNVELPTRGVSGKFSLNNELGNNKNAAHVESVNLVKSQNIVSNNSVSDNEIVKASEVLSKQHGTSNDSLTNRSEITDNGLSGVTQNNCSISSTVTSNNRVAATSDLLKNITSETPVHVLNDVNKTKMEEDGLLTSELLKYFPDRNSGLDDMNKTETGEGELLTSELLNDIPNQTPGLIDMNNRDTREGEMRNSELLADAPSQTSGSNDKLQNKADLTADVTFFESLNTTAVSKDIIVTTTNHNSTSMTSIYQTNVDDEARSLQENKPIADMQLVEIKTREVMQITDSISSKLEQFKNESDKTVATKENGCQKLNSSAPGNQVPMVSEKISSTDYITDKQKEPSEKIQANYDFDVKDKLLQQTSNTRATVPSIPNSFVATDEQNVSSDDLMNDKSITFNSCESAEENIITRINEPAVSSFSNEQTLSDYKFPLNKTPPTIHITFLDNK